MPDTERPLEQSTEEASTPRRLLAFLVDAGVLTVPAALILFAFFPEEIAVAANGGGVTVDPWSAKFLMGMAAIATLSVFYSAGLEVSPWRGTLGKRLLLLRVAGDDLEPAPPGRPIIRNVLRLAWFVPLLGPVLFVADGVLVVVRKQRMGDIAASTRVVKVTGHWIGGTDAGDAETD